MIFSEIIGLTTLIGAMITISVAFSMAMTNDYTLLYRIVLCLVIAMFLLILSFCGFIAEIYRSLSAIESDLYEQRKN